MRNREVLAFPRRSRERKKHIIKPIWLRRLSFVLLFSFLLITCKDEETPAEDCAVKDRVGAVCRDGSTTTRTGKGTCSDHGGVGLWKCKW